MKLGYLCTFAGFGAVWLALYTRNLWWLVPAFMIVVFDFVAVCPFTRTYGPVWRQASPCRGCTCSRGRHHVQR